MSPSFTLAFQNTGDRDFVLNLGLMLANGKMMTPSAVRLILTDSAGNVRSLQYFDRRYGGIRGRVDDFIVALRMGATYVFRVSLGDYWSEATKEFGIKLEPGKYRISVRFEGEGAQFPNLDMQGVGLLNFWKGTAQSSTLEFEVSP
jgi:hypothetical protein